MLVTLQDLDLTNKRVLIRVDLNVPMDEHGVIQSDIRLRACLDTIQAVLSQGGAAILLSHLGRPTEGEFEPKFSLAPVAERLSELLQKPVCFAKDWLHGVEAAPGEIVLCENVRFNKGEKANDPALAQTMARLGDVFVMDAFATAHRKQASTFGIAEHLPSAAGPLLLKEIQALQQALHQPKRPLVAVVGGAKVSSKFSLLKNLMPQVDQLIVGGGIANTFLAANGIDVGASLHEPDMLKQAKELLASDKIPLPSDVIVAKAFDKSATATLKSIHQIESDDLILDIGPDSAANYAQICQQAGTIVWNGPVGVFEWTSFSKGTKVLSEAIAKSPAFSIAGGGDTINAIEQFNLSQDINYISTGGGAFLTYLESNTLPVLEVLQR